MKKVLLFLFIYSMNTFALPEHVHFFFISPENVSLIEGLKEEKFYFSKLSVENSFGGLECVQMGDGCFNPQVGFIPNDSKDSPKKEMPKEIKTINAIDVDLINCEDGNYFDIFCGKARKESASKALVEVWIDTSSSMRSVDYSKDTDYCERRIIARKFRDECGQKVNMQVFDTSLKQMGALPTACMNYGLNDQKRLMKWISDSSAKQLYVFTDIDELSLELKDFLDTVPSTIYGAEQKKYTMKEVLKMTDKAITKYCK